MDKIITLQRYVRDGKIAVLYSPGYGSGWSSWNDDEYKDDLMHHPEFVKKVLENKQSELTEEFCQNVLGTTHYICTAGACDLEVEWMPMGSKYIIEEFDGSESIEYC